MVNDLDILLLGPQGRVSLLVSDGDSSASNNTLTIDDPAPDTFAAPVQALSKGSRLADFNGSDTNDEWRFII